MLVMQTNSKNFQGMANKIAKDFFVNGVAIEDGVVKLAHEYNLTPEEVRRLVEKSNTASSVLFLKHASDKKATFKLAKVDNVLSRTHPLDTYEYNSTNGGNQIIKNAVVEGSLPESRSRYDIPIFELTKSAKTVEKPNRFSPAADYKRLVDFIEHKKQEKLAAEMVLQEVVNTMIGSYSRNNCDSFSKLAAEAVAIYGDSIKTVLEPVADYIGEELHEKIAVECVDDTTDNMKLLKKAFDALSSYKETSEDIQAAEKFLHKIQSSWGSMTYDNKNFR